MPHIKPKLDNIYSVEIPEGVELQAELAGVVPRTLAFCIDFSIRAGLLIVVSIAAAFLGKAGDGIVLIFFFLLEWFYPVFFELYVNGQTPGKKLFNIKVVQQDLIPIKLQSSLIRNLLRTVDFLPLLYVFGIVSMVMSTKFQRLGDLAAGTLVIYKPHQPVSQFNHDIAVDAIAPQYPLTEDQQVAIIEFAQSRAKLSRSRQEEIAAILGDYIPQKYNDPVAYLQGVGKWLLGKS